MKIEELLQLNREELRHYYEEDHSSDGKENNIVLKDGKKGDCYRQNIAAIHRRKQSGRNKLSLQQHT